MALRLSEPLKIFRSAICVFRASSSERLDSSSSAAARVNMEMGLLDKTIGNAIVKAAQEVQTESSTGSLSSTSFKPVRALRRT